ncbi:IclR family transcriptional regulator [Brevundimonas sp. FT23028]|uniref:IclR family transcriptional regulator n=1 Tax=Brevundimonas sp. FT23028 TaxID=3393748 RepID=UPI003B588D6B
MLDSADDDGRKYRAPALEKGLDVLELLSQHGAPLTPSQMSALLGRSVSELFRMIQVLEFRGYIEPTASGYRLTNRLFTLGIAHGPAKDLVEAALPHMRELAEATVQSCHLVVRSGDQIVVVARIEAPGDLGYSVRIGYRRKVIEATSGLLFYGFASERTRAQLRESLTARHGRKQVADYVAAAETAATLGHAERPSDFVKGVTDLVAPIIGAEGILATLITPYIERTPAVGSMADATEQLRRAAAAISGEMGHSAT